MQVRIGNLRLEIYPHHPGHGWYAVFRLRLLRGLRSRVRVAVGEGTFLLAIGRRIRRRWRRFGLQALGQIGGRELDAEVRDDFLLALLLGAHPSLTVEGARGRGFGEADLFLRFVLLTFFEGADLVVAPVLELMDGLSEIVFFVEGGGEVVEVLVVHHAGERFGFVEEGLFLLGLFLLHVGVALVFEEAVLEDDLFSVGAGCQARIVNVHDDHFQLHLGLDFPCTWIDAFAGVKLHVLDSLFGLVCEFGLKLQATGHIASDLMAGWD